MTLKNTLRNVTNMFFYVPDKSSEEKANVGTDVGRKGGGSSMDEEESRQRREGGI